MSEPNVVSDSCIRGALSVTDASDAELLARFVDSRDETAFAALMFRHGPMVFGVCRRLLHHTQDAEDAFQATFLILVRKAANIGKRELLGNWLYGVALRVANRARVMAAKQRMREAKDMERISQTTREPMETRDVSIAITEEVQRLPSKYRIPIILCYLEGRSNEEVAGELRCPVGTVKTRLSRAREMLRKRLTNRGLALSAAAFSTALSVEALAAPVPPAVIDSALKAALDFAAGDAAVLGFVSAQAAALTKGVLHTMFVSKMKTVVALVLAFGVVISGVGAFSYHLLAPGPAPKKTDKENIQGAWQVVSVEKNGQEQDDKLAKQMKSFKWDIGAEKITIHQGDFDHVSSYKLDPTASPKTIDLISEEEGEKGLLIPAVYELKEDTLKICSPSPPKPLQQPLQRPKNVATKGGDNTILIVLKRVKK